MTGALALQLLVYGVTNGAVVALNAVGFTLAYAVSRQINLAHGNVFALATVGRGKPRRSSRNPGVGPAGGTGGRPPAARRLWSSVRSSPQHGRRAAGLPTLQAVSSATRPTYRHGGALVLAAAGRHRLARNVSSDPQR